MKRRNTLNECANGFASRWLKEQACRKKKLKEATNPFAAETVYTTKNGKAEVRKRDDAFEVHSQGMIDYDGIREPGWKHSFTYFPSAGVVRDERNGRSYLISKNTTLDDVIRNTEETFGEGLKTKQARPLNEDFDPEDEIRIYMNTWANYNENGADLSKYGINSISDGWLTVEKAIEFRDKYAEDEPFINDTENAPYDIGENDLSALDDLLEFEQMPDNDKKAVGAVMEATGDDFSSAKEIVKDGDYRLYNSDNFTDLAYEIIDELGGLGEALGDKVNNYIDEDAMRRDYKYDVRPQMEQNARDNPSEVAKENGVEEDDVTDEMIDDWVDSHIDDYLDSIIEEEVDMAERGEVDLSNYFDYEAYGRDLSFDGFHETSYGIVEIF